MDFGTLPPEITSAQMYSGPGSGPMLAAATAWKTLAAELLESAAAYRSAISGLAESWQGPSSAAMAAATAPYVTWIASTAAQAKDAADRLAAAASAYETAFAATVPPSMIAANRGQLASLMATNVFGQNTTAIAATEAQYGQMWLQNAATMYGYAGSAAAAARTTPFTAPPQTTDPAAPTAQSAASRAGVLGLITQTLDDLATGGAQFNAPVAEVDTALGGLVGSSSASALYEDMFATVAGVSKLGGISNVAMGAPNMGMAQFKTFFKPMISTVEIPMSSLGAALHAAPAATTASTVAAGTGQGSLVGRLSVPPTWASATPTIRLTATALPDPGLAAAPGAEISRSLLPAMALGSLAGSALGGAGPRVFNATGARGRTTAATLSKAPVKLDQVVAQLQQQPDSVQHWNVDEAGFDDLVAELAKKPGVHAVHMSGK